MSVTMIRVCMCVHAQSCSTLCDPMGCSMHAMLLSPWNYPGKNTEVSCHFLLQGIFPTQGLNLYCMHLLHRQADSLLLSHLGSRYHTVKRFNMNKLWQHYAKCKKLITEDHKLYDSDYEMSKIWKSIETKRWVVAKDLGHEGGEWLQSSMGLLWGVIKTT